MTTSCNRGVWFFLRSAKRTREGGSHRLDFLIATTETSTDAVIRSIGEDMGPVLQRELSSSLDDSSSASSRTSDDRSQFQRRSSDTTSSSTTQHSSAKNTTVQQGSSVHHSWPFKEAKLAGTQLYINDVSEDMQSILQKTFNDMYDTIVGSGPHRRLTAHDRREAHCPEIATTRYPIHAAAVKPTMSVSRTPQKDRVALTKDRSIVGILTIATPSATSLPDLVFVCLINESHPSVVLYTNDLGVYEGSSPNGPVDAAVFQTGSGVPGLSSLQRWLGKQTKTLPFGPRSTLSHRRAC